MMGRDRSDAYESDADLGYEVTLTRRTLGGPGVPYDWHVQVRRLSDGVAVIRTFDWRWRARRFAGSIRRISREFDRMTRVSVEQREHFTWRFHNITGWWREADRG